MKTKLALVLTSTALIFTSCSREPEKYYEVQVLSQEGRSCKDSVDRVALTEFHKQNLASIQKLTLSGDDQDYEDAIEASINMSIDAVCPTYYRVFSCKVTESYLKETIKNPRYETNCSETNKLVKEIILK